MYHLKGPSHHSQSTVSHLSNGAVTWRLCIHPCRFDASVRAFEGWSLLQGTAVQPAGTGLVSDLHWHWHWRWTTNYRLVIITHDKTSWFPTAIVFNSHFSTKVQGNTSVPPASQQPCRTFRIGPDSPFITCGQGQCHSSIQVLLCDYSSQS